MLILSRMLRALRIPSNIVGLTLLTIVSAYFVYIAVYVFIHVQQGPEARAVAQRADAEIRAAIVPGMTTQ
jgi:hypothetical protein